MFIAQSLKNKPKKKIFFCLTVSKKIENEFQRMSNVFLF
jgi:hypothetical protein